MKVRTGFVSNSSSSSFIVAVKNGGEFTTDHAKKVLESTGIIDVLAEKLVQCAGEGMDIIEFFREKCVEDLSDLYDEEAQVIKNNKEAKFFAGRCDDQEEFAEAFLCDTSIDYEDDEVVVKKEGGY